MKVIKTHLEGNKDCLIKVPFGIYRKRYWSIPATAAAVEQIAITASELRSWKLIQKGPD